MSLITKPIGQHGTSLRTALLALDLQNDFLCANGMLPVRKRPEMVDNIIKLAKVIRASGGVVIWIRSEFEAHRVAGKRQVCISDKVGAPGFLHAGIEDPDAFLSNGATCVQRGNPGAQLARAIRQAQTPEDYVLTKTYYSAFQSDQLPGLLELLSVGALAICGALSNVSVYATALTARRYGFSVTVVENCCGYRDEKLHAVAMNTLTEEARCTVADSDQFVSILGGPEKKKISFPPTAMKIMAIIKAAREERTRPSPFIRTYARQKPMAPEPGPLTPARKVTSSLFPSRRSVSKYWRKILRRPGWWRPKVRAGFRRIEWNCHCGSALYGDFPSDTKDIDELERALKRPLRLVELLVMQQSGRSSASNSSSLANPHGASSGTSRGRNSTNRADSVSATMSRSASPTYIVPSGGGGAGGNTGVGQVNSPPIPNYLAMCVNTGDIYKTLAEIETSQIMSDSQAFLKMREKYLEVRGFRSRFHALVKPVTLRFVKFQLWDLRNGYISICEQDCIPSDRTEYDYVPSDIKPPPMPPEVFIHYLEHDEGDISPLRNHWLPRLPKKRRTRVITDATLGSDAWGIHIIEGPNREVVFWVCLATIAASVVAGVLWSGLRADVPGGMGIGSLAVAVPPAVLAIFLFRMGGL